MVSRIATISRVSYICPRLDIISRISGVRRIPYISGKICLNVPRNIARNTSREIFEMSGISNTSRMSRNAGVNRI